jgi:hypothetical protein
MRLSPLGQGRLGPWLRAAQIARDQAPEVFGEGHTHIAGTLARPALNFRLERDLRA